MQAEYVQLMKSIKDGILRHNKKEITGALLLQGRLTMSEWEEREEIISLSLENTAYSVLLALKMQFGSELEIIDEDGIPILTEYDKK